MIIIYIVLANVNIFCNYLYIEIKLNYILYYNYRKHLYYIFSMWDSNTNIINNIIEKYLYNIMILIYMIYIIYFILYQNNILCFLNIKHIIIHAI